MPLKTALLIACLLVAPGVVLRVAPYVDRIAGTSHVSAPVEPTTAPKTSTAASSRLSQRPIVQVAIGFGIEVALHVALIVILLRSMTLVALFRSQPRSARWAMCAFFVTLIAGFFGGRDQTFPFVAWRMYSGRPAGDPRIVRLDGETRAGAQVSISLDELIPAMGPRRPYHVLEELSRVQPEADGANAEGGEPLRATLLALGQLYNARHGDDPLARIRLSVAHVPLDNEVPPWMRGESEIVTVVIDPSRG